MVVNMLDNNLRFCREDIGMTQKELGYVFGVSDRAIRSWESGSENIPLIKLMKFCNLYDFSLDYVVGLRRGNICYGKFESDKFKIGKKLKELRTSLNLTQEKLSDDCKIAQTTYSDYERGRTLITTDKLYYICKTYNISMDYIVGRSKKQEIN